MKPTQEQVIAWAREAGLTLIEDCCDVPDKFCGQNIWRGNIYVAFLLAYEAGRKDENEACVMVCRTLADEGEDEHVWARITCAVALRERFK